MHSNISPRHADDRQASDPAVLTIIQALDRPSELSWDNDHATQSGIYGFNSIDPRSRSFNLIRGRLLEFKRTRGFRLVGVVSATPNVGKSFVAANIASSLSRDPQIRTFLADLDLRRGSVSERFGIVPGNGLSGYLSDANPLEVVSLAGQNLTIIPTHGGMIHSAELLAGAKAQTLFRAMRSSDEANLFICDLPPVFANDDAVAVMSYLDCYVLVSEEGTTTEREIKDSVEALGRGKLAGVVLNKFRGGVMSDGYGVDTYYARGYGEDDRAR